MSAENYKDQLLEKDINNNIVFIGVFGSTARGTSLNIKTKDITLKSDIDVFVITNEINSTLVKNIYKLANNYEPLDVTLYSLDALNVGLKSNILLSVLFLNIFENGQHIYKTKEFELFVDKLKDLAEQNKEFHEKYKEVGRSYALVKDIMNSIKKSILLENYNAEI